MICPFCREEIKDGAIKCRYCGSWLSQSPVASRPQAIAQAMPYAGSAGDAIPSERAAFIRKTYLHLAFAILAFMVIEALLLRSSIAETLVEKLTDGYAWLAVLGAFMVVSWLAERLANSETSQEVQYLGLGIYIVAEAILFLPLLYVAANYSSDEVIPTAGLITGFLFLGLTAFVFATKSEFSWMRGILMIGGFVALGVIVASILFEFNLGVIFAAIMVIFAAGAILNDTSQVLHHYRTDQHVAASLALFASVGLLFWYVLRIVISLYADD